jgi:hypothetical protein
MAYTEILPNFVARSAATPLSLTAAAQIEEHVFFQGANIRQFNFYVTTAPTVTAPVIVLYKRTAVGITSGQVALATITIPVGTPAGSIVYKLLDSSDVLPGQALASVVTTAATAGAGLPGYDMYHDPEVPMNVPVMIQSA